MRVVKGPKIQFGCSSCGATNEGEEDEFMPQHTMPPSWMARCAFCESTVRVFPTALIAREAARAANALFPRPSPSMRQPPAAVPVKVYTVRGMLMPPKR